MISRRASLFVVAIGLIALTSCSKIQEPWVSSDTQLKQERSRSVEQQMQLRNRLVFNQVDDRMR